MKILLTNDDGIEAEGLFHLFEAIKDIAEVLVVAPKQEKSGSGLSITITTPLEVKSIDWPKGKAYSVSGTPADCVKMALSLMDYQPDLILSGINKGSNSGRNVLYSGTIGGVVEGVLRGIPGIAFSCYEVKEPDYERACLYIKSLVDHFSEHPIPQGSLINVNFPPKDLSIEGIKMARQGGEYWVEDISHHKEDHYWLGGQLFTLKESLEFDTALLKEGYITAVPLHVGELTDHNHIEAHKDRFEKHFENIFRGCFSDSGQ